METSLGCGKQAWLEGAVGGAVTFRAYTLPMKFFIPAAEDAAQADKVYEGARKFNSEQMGATLSPRRIYRVAGVHDGKPFTATVGELFERLREVVVAILLDTSRDVYFICTANRGVVRGEPYLSGAHEIRDAEDFEE